MHWRADPKWKVKSDTFSTLKNEGKLRNRYLDISISGYSGIIIEIYLGHKNGNKMVSRINHC
jgi:hypothetical protein